MPAAIPSTDASDFSHTILDQKELNSAHCHILSNQASYYVQSTTCESRDHKHSRFPPKESYPPLLSCLYHCYISWLSVSITISMPKRLMIHVQSWDILLLTLMDLHPLSLLLMICVCTPALPQAHVQYFTCFSMISKCIRYQVVYILASSTRAASLLMSKARI